MRTALPFAADCRAATPAMPKLPTTFKVPTILAVCLAGAMSAATSVPTAASTIAPPMLDITHRCDATSRRNVRAMSECVVAESEARSEVLQKWDKLSDASAEKCIGLGRKAKKFPYGVLAKCVALEPVDPRAAARPPIVTKPEEAYAGEGGSMTDWFLKKTGIRK